MHRVIEAMTGLLVLFVVTPWLIVFTKKKESPA